VKKLPALHQAVMANDLEKVAHLLRAGRVKIDAVAEGDTALMHALEDPDIAPEMAELLLQNGADFTLNCRNKKQDGRAGKSTVQLAVKAGSLRKLQALRQAGASFHYRDAQGYDALLDATYSLIRHEPGHLDLLRFLIAEGVELNGVSQYGESALRVLSAWGRFDAVRLLRDAGADRALLGWTPLLEAIALQPVEEVRRLLAEGAGTEDQDANHRTPWLLAVQMGDLAKAEALRAGGADIQALDHVGRSALFYAAEAGNAEMARWLTGLGFDPNQPDGFGCSALFECRNVEVAKVLLEAGADLEKPSKFGTGVLQNTHSAELARLYLDAGADPGDLSGESRRSFLGFSPEPDERRLQDIPVTAAEFQRARSPRSGRRNPEIMDEPFWQAMIRAGVSAYSGNKAFNGPSPFDAGPVWCAMRFGQSMTFLPDGRIVLIGGEHEDHYDPDFYIYNDVSVRDPDGKITIYGYPRSDFPPTDFHTATLVGNAIYVIGCLGYPEHRRPGFTPVYRLDLSSMAFEAVPCTGAAPGWIYRHRAQLVSPEEIRIWGGKIAGENEHVENERACLLDVRTAEWRAL